MIQKQALAILGSPHSSPIKKVENLQIPITEERKQNVKQADKKGIKEQRLQKQR